MGLGNTGKWIVRLLLAIMVLLILILVKDPLLGIGRGLATFAAKPTATPTIVRQQPAPAPATGGTNLPTATPASPEPTKPPVPTIAVPTAAPTLTPRPATAAPTSVAVPTTVITASKTITLAFDSFGSYIKAADVVRRVGPYYKLNLIPFDFTEKQSYSEDQRAAAMASGNFDILFTTADSLAKYGDVGQIVAIIDRSAGADKVVAYNVCKTTGRQVTTRLNDIVGCKITYSEGSVSEFAVLMILRSAGLKPSDVILDPKESTSDAIDEFLAGNADVISAWEPIVNSTIISGTTHAILDSTWWNGIMDVIVLSKQADSTKRDTILAFMTDWFLAVKKEQEDLPGMAQTIADWKFGGETTNDWTGISAASPITGYKQAVTDYQQLVAHLAEADLAANVIAMQNPDIVSGQVEQSRETWALANKTKPGFDRAKLVNPWYVMQLASGQSPYTKESLYPTKGGFVNQSFQLVADKVPAVSLAVLTGTLQTVIELPCKQFDFTPDSTALTITSTKALQECANPMLEMMKVSDIQILITGWSAWPYKEPAYTLQETYDFSILRAKAIQTAISNIPGMKPYVYRIQVQGQVPPQDAWNTKEESRMAPYRKVVIEAKRAGTGR